MALPEQFESQTFKAKIAVTPEADFSIFPQAEDNPSIKRANHRHRQEVSKTLPCPC